MNPFLDRGGAFFLRCGCRLEGLALGTGSLCQVPDVGGQSDAF